MPTHPWGWGLLTPCPTPTEEGVQAPTPDLDKELLLKARGCQMQGGSSLHTPSRQPYIRGARPPVLPKQMRPLQERRARSPAPLTGPRPALLTKGHHGDRRHLLPSQWRQPGVRRSRWGTSLCSAPACVIPARPHQARPQLCRLLMGELEYHWASDCPQQVSAPRTAQPHKDLGPRASPKGQQQLLPTLPQGKGLPGPTANRLLMPTRLCPTAGPGRAAHSTQVD